MGAGAIFRGVGSGGPRFLSHLFLAGLLVLAAVRCAAQSQPTEGEMLAEAESASGAKRAKLYLRLSERRLIAAKTEYDNGDSEQGQAALNKFRGYAQEAFQTAEHTGKYLKQTEITLRNFGRKLEGLKRSVAFEDQKPIAETELEIQHMRDGLMRKMWQR